MGIRSEAWAMREKNRVDLAAVNSVKEELKGRVIDVITKRMAVVEERIKELQEEKEELCRTKITRAELLENAIAAFRKQRARYLDEILAKHLQGCQAAGVEPFYDVAMRIDFWNEYRGMNVFFLAASEADIKEAVKLVPEGDMSTKERIIKIKAIDDQIDSLRADVERELAQERAKP